MWQFRTRVPADLQAVLGRTHINRSLRTSSHPDAIRAARRVAFEIEKLFDAARGGTGNDPADAACDRACRPPPAHSVTANTVLPDPTGPAIQIDLNLLWPATSPKNSKPPNQSPRRRLCLPPSPPR